MKRSFEVKEWHFGAILAAAVLAAAVGMYWWEQGTAGADFSRCPLCGEVSR